MKESVTIRINSINKIEDFVAISKKFNGEINAIQDIHYIDGKSLQGILLLDTTKDIIIEAISSTGKEIDNYFKKIKKYIASGS